MRFWGSICVKSFCLLATRAASGSNPSPSRPHMGWIHTPMIPNHQGPGGGVAGCTLARTMILRTRLEWKLKCKCYDFGPLKSHRGRNSGQAGAEKADPPVLSATGGVQALPGASFDYRAAHNYTRLHGPAPDCCPASAVSVKHNSPTSAEADMAMQCRRRR